MANGQPVNVDYGFSQALNAVFPAPIISNRAPTTADRAPLGQVWIKKSTNDFYVLTSIVNNLANWTTNTNGSGIFTSITVTTGPNDIEGTTTINTAGSASTSIGNNSGASGIAMLVGTGNFSLDGAAGSTYSIGASTVGGTVTIGGTAQTGNFILAPSTAAGTVALANGNGAKAINIGNGVSGNTISIGNGINTSAQIVNIANGASGANSTVNILSGIGTAGAAVLLLGNNTRATTIDLGNIAPAAARVISIAGGNSAQNDTVTIFGGAPSANTQTFNLFSGVATGGTQVANICTGASAHAINVGTGAAVVNTIAVGGTGANVITVANTQTAGSVSIGAAMTTGTINIGSALSGLVTLPAVPVSAAGTTVVNNVRVGQAIYTGNITGAATALVLTLTNSLISATSSIFMTVSNLGANDAQMTLYRVKPGAGTCEITLFNNGAAALNGDVQVSFWVN